MATGLYSWSQTAGDNDDADSTINWAEGQAPSTVNNSARAVMAVLSKWRDDISGVKPSNTVMTTGGTANAQTLSTNGSIAALTNGWTVTFEAGASNTDACTLAVDSLTAKQIQRISGTNLTGGEILEGASYTVTYHQPADAWILRSSGFNTTLVGLTSGTVSSSANQSHVLTAYTGYRVLRFVYTNVDVSNDGVSIDLRTSTDGGSNYDSGASDYKWAGYLYTSSGAGGFSEDTSDSSIEIFNSIGNASGESAHFEVRLYKPSNATLYKRIAYEGLGFSTGGEIISVRRDGSRISTEDIDAIQFLVSAGTFSADYAIYGLV